MRIYFERSGGFTGMRLESELDSKSLPVDEVLALQEMIEASGFFSLPKVIPSSAEGADRFQYRVTVVETIWRRHTVEVSESAVPEPLKPLLEKLATLARAGRIS